MAAWSKQTQVDIYEYIDINSRFLRNVARPFFRGMVEETDGRNDPD